MKVSDLDTPALLVDLDVVERNLRRASDYARQHRLRLRPHTKTHKIPEFGRRQLALGAAGLTVAKLGEAEVMVSAGPPELLVAYPVLGPRKLGRLLALARETRLTVALDSLAAAGPLSEAAAAAGRKVGVLAEVDVGLGRVGVQPGRELTDLAKQLDRLPGLELQGVEFYPGHIKALDEGGLRAIDRLSATVGQILEDFDRAGLNRAVISGGSTPTLFQSHRVRGMNEIRPGTYIFNDRNTAACGSCRLEDCAASILVTVVSTARQNGMIIDGGSKTFSSDRLVTGGDETWGRIVEAPAARFFRMNEEHGYVDLTASPRKFQVGDRVRVLPNHICVAVNLHERIYGIRGDQVEEVWPVEGRGKLQ
jgi:D-serine deaminase-like pyridoxal phosphate-dependent protein